MTAYAHSAESVVHTDRAGRYLAQLCEHLAAIGPVQRAHVHDGGPQAPTADGDPPAPLIATDIRRSSTLATIRFADGTCRLIADGDTLRLRLNADNAEAIERMKTSFAHRVEQIGRRDNLTVNWVSETEQTSVAGRAARRAQRHPY